LRKQLKELIANYPVVQLTPIDLSDGSDSDRPPLVECLGYVRRAEFMILLPGDTYAVFAGFAANDAVSHPWRTGAAELFRRYL
jgi:hypothetical protein